MSQAGDISAIAGPVPPAVPTQFTTDVLSPSIPVANNLNVRGGQSSDNTNFGIQTSGGSGSDTLTIQLTNRVTGTLTTNDNTFRTIISFPLGSVPGVYKAEGDITAYNTTIGAGSSYGYAVAARTDGTNGFELGAEDKGIFEEPTMSGCDFQASVVGNNAILEVKGIGTDVIHWSAIFTYRFVS